ncbi:hypothetical protein [[Eubacterium] cellulosolvens]
MRRVSSMLVVLFLIMSGFGFLISFDMVTEDARAFEVKSGTISADEIWSSSPIYIASSVTIDNANITINPGINIIFNNSAYKITLIKGSITAIGSKNQPILFNSTSSATTIEVQQLGRAVFDWCVFGNSTGPAISLISNQFNTKITNCTFDISCSRYFALTNSKVNVTSCRFNYKQFDNSTVLTSNLNNKLTINDAISELYIEYFVNVKTVGPYLNPLNDINVDVSDQRHNTIGRTDSNGMFWYGPATAVKIYKPGGSAGAQFGYQTTATASDKWDGITGREEPGISRNQTTISNVSSEAKDSDYYILIEFTFKYPPKIDTSLNNVKVNEDQNRSVAFVIHDNDDLDFAKGENNLTINITDKDGRGIYGSNTEDRWVSWSNLSGGQLHLYRTIESPFSPPKPDDYDAVVHEDIYFTITDPHNQKATIGPIDVEFTNVPDKPVITGLPSSTAITVVTEDIEKVIPITVTDNDNTTNEIVVYSSSDYVTYEYVNPTTQNLKLNYPNEFGENDKQEQVFVNATDGCSDEVVYSFLVKFIQTPDSPQIVGEIPNKYGYEDTWESDMSLGTYAYDPDPDDSTSTLKWYVTGLDKKVYGKQLFTVSNQNATADAPLSFNLNPEIDLGGARKSQSIKDDITLWLMDKDGNSTSQDISLVINSTNQPPSMHKIEIEGKKQSVVPQEGTSSDTYKFQIEYRDLDGEKGDAPEYIKVFINGNGYEMIESDSADTDYSDGKLYYYIASMLTPGEYEHHFECSDSELITRLPLLTADPPNFEGPSVEAKLFILRKESIDGNFIARIAHRSMNAFADIVDAPKPSLELEPDKDEVNKTKGDMGTYFKIDISRIDTLLWVEVVVEFGMDYGNYNTTWLRKNDMQLAHYSPSSNQWTQLSFSIMDTKFKTLTVNMTPQTGQAEVLSDMVNTTNAPIFTVVGILDADGDNYYNPKDAFPFDPAAREDRDKDGSPGKNEWVPGKDAKDSTTGLHEDKFSDDPAASKDDDSDRCPDEWNPGKTQKDSTTGLTLDKFPNNPGACEDTDGDGMPDVLIKEKDTQNLIEDPDDDNDGLPDWWEDEKRQIGLEKGYEHLFDPKNASDANKDFDGDGVKNIDEYKKNKDPYKKDADEGVLSQPTVLLVLLIVIIIVIVLAAFILRKRGKKGEDEPEGGVEGAPGPEFDEGPVPPESRVGAPEPPESVPSPEGDQIQMESEELEMEEAIPPTEEGEGAIMEEAAAEPMVEAPAEIEQELPPQVEQPAPGTIEPGAPVEEQVPPPEPEAPLETTEPMPEPEAMAMEFSCPNCGTALTRDMTACPGCSAPLMFD